MLENSDSENISAQNDRSGRCSSSDYLDRAREACESGDALLGLHLYLAAFEKAACDSPIPEESAIAGLKQAWSIAVSLHESALAEHVFEKLDPFVTDDEREACMQQLQELSIDKLASVGVSQEDLEELTSAIAEEFFGENAKLVHVESIVDGLRIPAPAHLLGKGNEPGEESCDECRHSCGLDDGVKANKPVSDDTGEPTDDAAGSKGQPAEGSPQVLSSIMSAIEQAGVRFEATQKITYADLAGYDKVVRSMRDLGIGMQDDEQFKELVGLLNRRYGLEKMPATDSLLFRSVARDDAEEFMLATLGEIGLPCVRMRMTEVLPGQYVLSLLVENGRAPGLNASRSEFLGSGVLVLEDIDLWVAPFSQGESGQQVPYAQMPRGVREAVGLIRSAVLNPDAYVIATADANAPIDDFFLDLLEPLSIVDIAVPTPEERIDVWMDIARARPSLRSISIADLVRLSANMSRCEMRVAADEAIGEAYKMSLMKKSYVPVSRDNLFEKLAAFQPLDSREYRELEEIIVADFRKEIGTMDDFGFGSNGEG